VLFLFTVCLNVVCVCIDHKVIKTHQIERTLRIAKELSDLIVYCRPVSYDTEKGKLVLMILVVILCCGFLVSLVNFCNVNVNVNVHLYSAKITPLMHSMCRVLFKKKRLQCTTETVNLHVRLTQIVLEQVPCRRSSDSEGATAVRIKLKPWNNE